VCHQQTSLRSGGNSSSDIGSGNCESDVAPEVEVVSTQYTAEEENEQQLPYNNTSHHAATHCNTL